MAMYSPALIQEVRTCNISQVHQGGRKSLAGKCEYIMHGKSYKISDEGSGKSLKAEIYISYGGLLMMLKGDPTYFLQFELDQRLFLLMRKL